MTWRVQCLHQDTVADLKGRVVFRRASHAVTVFAANDGKVGVLGELCRLGRAFGGKSTARTYDLLVASSMIPMTV